MTTSDRGADAEDARRGFWAGVRRAPVVVLLSMVRLYQRFLSPLTPPSCKYYPSCSSYAVTALQRHGALKGSVLAAWRVLRCNPWSRGGVDDVPPRGTWRSPTLHSPAQQPIHPHRNPNVRRRGALDRAA